MSGGPLLRLESVTVDFDGFLALNRIDFAMDRGEMRFVIGPNGAGKTSLLDVVTGLVRPSAGNVVFAGERSLVGLPPHEIAALGIGRKFQTPSVFPQHTVRENMQLARRAKRGVLHTLGESLRPPLRSEIDETLERVGLEDLGRRPAGMLSHGHRQWLEIAMLLIQRPRLLLLDEPAAGMTGQEREQTALLLRSIASEHSLLVIEHDMEFIRSLAETVTVLHAGSVLCQGTLEEVQADPAVRDVYLGRSATPAEPARETA